MKESLALLSKFLSDNSASDYKRSCRKWHSSYPE